MNEIYNRLYSQNSYKPSTFGVQPLAKGTEKIINTWTLHFHFSVYVSSARLFEQTQPEFVHRQLTRLPAHVYVKCFSHAIFLDTSLLSPQLVM
jgi:hypothetical protein